MHEHRVAVSHRQLLLLPVRLSEDGKVREDHDGAGNPERDRARHQRVNFIDDEAALVGMEYRVLHVAFRRIQSCKRSDLYFQSQPIFSELLTSEDGNKRQQRRRCPTDQDHDGDFPLRHVYWVLQRLHYSVISVSDENKQ